MNDLKVKYYKVKATEEKHKELMNQNTINSNIDSMVIFDKVECDGDIDILRGLYSSCIQREAERNFDEELNKEEQFEYYNFINDTLDNLEPILHDRWYCHNIKGNKDIEREKSEVGFVALDLINNENIDRDQTIKIRSWTDGIEEIKPISNMSNIEGGLSIIIE